MSDCNDARDIQRLRQALNALASDLDAIESRPHLMLRHSDSRIGCSPGLEGFVEHFAFVVERARFRPA
jgi:hypothetical protein